MAADVRSFEEALKDVLQYLKDLGFDYDLKKEQEEGLKQLYHGKDLLAVLPTGYGKSLIFQLLSLMARGKYISTTSRPIILVVTPLVSIIQDQIMEVEAMGLKGYNLNDALDNLDSLAAVDMLYASAESVIDQFLSFLKKNNNSFCQRVIAFVVDESHTVETWSGLRAEREDGSKKARDRQKQATAFRSAFGQLSILRSFFTQGTAFAALTGTQLTHQPKILYVPG